MIATIHQPQYIPWLGYFDKIDKADIFVILDNVQYKKNEWQNRNRIKTINGWQWLTVPVLYKFPEKINEVKVNNKVDWRRKHFQALLTNYAKAPYFSLYKGELKEIFEKEWNILSDINTHLIKYFLKVLGIKTKVVIASQFDLSDEPSERLIDICKIVNADKYLSGKDGINYMKTERFKEEGIELMFQEFEPPVYDQMFGDFVIGLSIIDLLFNYGQKSRNVLKHKTV